jgi:hypothetical protein
MTQPAVKADDIHQDDAPADSTPSPKPPIGNSVFYAARRLGKERPDLMEKVKAGEMSSNAATISVRFKRVPTLLEQARKAC